MPTAYQSPIKLHLCHSCNINISNPIFVKGTNKGAIYDPSSHIFVVTDRIILIMNSKKYQLDEYHFHNPGEHDVNGKIYDAEVHYVFSQLKPGEKHTPDDYKCRNVCNCNDYDRDHDYSNDTHDRNILVIGRVISPSRHHEIPDLERAGDVFPKEAGERLNSVYECRRSLSDTPFLRLQVDTESNYYMYDGSLTTGSFAPVRWLVGDEPIYLNLDDIKKVSKIARPIQNIDGRIILFSEC